MTENKTNILLCTLGASWAVVPEVYAFLAPDRFPLYRNHPGLGEFENLRKAFSLAAPDEIWICTTCGKETITGIERLIQWIGLIPEPPILRIWQANGTDQLANSKECDDLRELLLRAVLKAHEQSRGGQVVLSLAGGRKTMSADLQWAGHTLGCDALLHVVGKEPLPEVLKKGQPADLGRPLDAGIAEYIVPLIVGRGRRSELLDVEEPDRGPVDAHTFDLPVPEPCRVLKWETPPGNPLQQEIRDREKAGSRLFGNYIAMLSKAEPYENWRSLYRLPPDVIRTLRSTSLNKSHRALLNELPKADLHRHLGGCLDIQSQRRVGRAIWDSMTDQAKSRALGFVGQWLQTGRWPEDWPQRLKQSGMRSECCAALLVEAGDGALQHHLYETTAPRIDLKQTHSLGFAAYELPGELSGSALLSHPAALEPYVEQVIKQAAVEGLDYLELRGSPHKYGDGLEFVRRFNASVHRFRNAIAQESRPEIRFILIGDRRSPEALAVLVSMAVRAKDEFGDLIVGLDVAGDEGTSPPEKLAQFFEPAFEACLPLTIHAGEGEPADRIWQAAYRLHADRIGHGLTIAENERLAQRFRDRNICLELCPTSNCEVIGFHDPDIAGSSRYPIYPIRKFIEMGLPLTLCTDNPGISRTTLTDEFLTAARMAGGEISLWTMLAIIRQGFSHAFLPNHKKQKLMIRIEQQIYQIVLEHFGREARKE